MAALADGWGRGVGIGINTFPHTAFSSSFFFFSISSQPRVHVCARAVKSDGSDGFQLMDVVIAPPSDSGYGVSERLDSNAACCWMMSVRKGGGGVG